MPDGGPVNEIASIAPGPASGCSLAPPRADLPIPTYESHSSLSTYRECPLRYAFRYVEHVPGEERPDQYAFGSGIHHAFEVFVRERIRADRTGGRTPGADLLWAALDESLAGSGLSPDAVEEARLRARPALELFLANEEARAVEPVAVEIGFGITVRPPGLDDGIRFVGYIDRVDRSANGDIEILDYKTGRLRDQADVDADRQLTAYAFAAARGALRDPATGDPLPAASRLGLYFADVGVTIWTSRDTAALGAFEADLVRTVERIRRRDFPARPAEWRCRWCEYGNACGQSALAPSPRDTAPGGVA